MILTILIKSCFCLVFETLGNNPSVGVSGQVYTLNYPCTSYSTCYPYTSTFPPGYYLIELWGAAGGKSCGNNPSGVGGYSIGVLYLGTNTNIYVYIGGQGTVGYTPATSIPGGYNGGGVGGANSGQLNTGGGGGGATDLRIGNNSISSRVIVAGGGGGGGYGCGSSKPGGKGGGLSGEKALDSDSYGIGGGGGSQLSGGSSAATNGATTGSFGSGGAATYLYGNHGAGGGGGGYYGGGGGALSTSTVSCGPSGGGGSGYIGGVISSHGYSASTGLGLGSTTHGSAKITFLAGIPSPVPTPVSTHAQTLNPTPSAIHLFHSSPLCISPNAYLSLIITTFSILMLSDITYSDFWLPLLSFKQF